MPVNVAAPSLPKCNKFSTSNPLAIIKFFKSNVIASALSSSKLIIPKYRVTGTLCEMCRDTTAKCFSSVMEFVSSIIILQLPEFLISSHTAFSITYTIASSISFADVVDKCDPYDLYSFDSNGNFFERSDGNCNASGASQSFISSEFFL